MKLSETESRAVTSGIRLSYTTKDIRALVEQTTRNQYSEVQRVSMSTPTKTHTIDGLSIHQMEVQHFTVESSKQLVRIAITTVLSVQRIVQS